MNNIGLYIGGTRKASSSGFGFIMNIGLLAGDEYKGEMDLSPVSRVSTDENPVITIKNADGYVFYRLWDNSICPSDAKPGNRGGTLVIGMTIPSQVRLRDNKSPYRLLIDIYEKFLEIGTKSEDGLIKFLDEDLDKAEFVKIIENYSPLEDTFIKQEVMKGDTIAEIQVPEEKMEDFFRDTQYPEFTRYKAVEVTTKGKNMFPGLEIPRPVSYEVFTNNKSANKFLQTSNDRFKAEITDEDNEDVEYDSLSFSLGELLDNKDNTRQNQAGTVVVKLDKNRRRIDCTLTPKPILYSWKPRFSRDSDSDATDFVKKGLKNKTIRIRLNGKDLNADDTIKASLAKAVKKEQIDIYPHETDGFILSVHKVEPDSFNRVVVIAIKAKTNDSKVGVTNHEQRERNHNIMDFVIGGVIGLALGVGGTLGTLKILEIRDGNNEATAYKDAYASSDTIVMKNYLKQYSALQFKYPNPEHLTEIEKKLDLARMEAEAANKAAKAEAELYGKCKDETKSFDERIQACKDYLTEDYKSKTEISNLKKDLETQKAAATTAEAERTAYNTWKKAKNQSYPKNYEACQTYIRGGYSNEENGKEVDGYIQTIQTGRNDILARLNLRKTVDSKYGSGGWKKYITDEEYKAITNILSPNFGTPIRNQNVKTYIKEEFGFPDNKKFSNFQEVKDLFDILKTIE